MSLLLTNPPDPYFAANCCRFSASSRRFSRVVRLVSRIAAIFLLRGGGNKYKVMLLPTIAYMC